MLEIETSTLTLDDEITKNQIFTKKEAKEVNFLYRFNSRKAKICFLHFLNNQTEHKLLR